MTTPNVGVPPVAHISWEFPSPEECCKSTSNGLSYEWCLSFCVLCCARAKITFDTVDTIPTGTNKTTPADNTRDQPVQNVTDSGISFTTSQYGLFIPIVFGSDKLTGNVFWASPIREHEIGTSNTTYRTIDFALGICEGEINGMLRMWVGDKLILNNTADTDGAGIVQPNADGYISGAFVDLTDPASPLRGLSAAIRQTKISVFAGTETQVPEGIMAITEGYDNSPGYRGLAYILFENYIIADSSIPAISVEITSNTQTLFPRSTVTLPSPKTRFNKVTGNMLMVDLSYNRVYVRGFEDQGTGTIPNSDGIVVYDYNTLNFLDEFDVKTTIAPSGTASGDYHIMQMSGKVMDHRSVGNAGYTYIYNPWTGTTESFLGPAGGVGGHNVVTGFSPILNSSCTFTTTGTSGFIVDAICGIGTVNQSVGFATLDDDGQLTMRSTFNAVLTKGVSIAKPLRILPKFAKTTFVDGGLTEGSHVIVVGWDSSETSTFKFTRFTLDGATGATITAPIMTEMGTISLDLLGGTSFIHTINDVLVDQTDNTLILLVSTSSSGRPGYICKYSPYTGTLLWKSSVVEFTGARTLSSDDFLRGREYAWINGTEIFAIDVTNGEVRTVTSNIATQNLPSLAGGQFYNSTENSITYISTDNTQYLVKVYLDRITRSTVDLKDIISLLLKRVGLLDTDITSSDLNAITLNGYTINMKKTLRSAFAELAQAFLYDVIESNGRIAYKTRGEASLGTIDHKYMLPLDDDGWLSARDSSDISKLRKINLTYRDLDREYRDNVQSVILPQYDNAVYDNDAAIDVTVPIVLKADDAKFLAEILLFAKLTYRTMFTGKLPARHLAYDPGDVVTLQLNDSGSDTVTARMRNIKISPNREVEFEAVEEDPSIYTDSIDLFSNVGRYEKGEFPPTDARIDPYIITIPYRSEADVTANPNDHILYLTFLNVNPNAAILRKPKVMVDNTTTYTLDGPFDFPTWGYVLVSPDNTVPLYSTDRTSTLRVKMMNTSGAALASVTLDDILNSDAVNLAVVGKELIQFTTVTSVGGDVYDFTVLHRAKLGTDVFARSHIKGERFILLADNLGVFDDLGIRKVILPGSANQRNAVQIFMNNNNPFQTTPIISYTALNQSPWTVANFNASYVSTDVVINWYHRVRTAGEWADDGSEALPVTEASSSFDVYLFTNLATFNAQSAATYLRKVTQSTEGFTYTAAMQTADAFDRTTTDLYIRVVQNGTALGEGGMIKTIRLPHL